MIGWDEWLNLQRFISCKRKKFLTPFMHLLNLRIRRNKINCSLKCNNNYFTTTISATSKHFWRGNYKCSNENCLGRFVAIIEKIVINKDVVIDFFVHDIPLNHEENEIKFRINGPERENLAKDLFIKGTMAVKAENIIFNEKNSQSFQSINSKI